MGDLLRLDDDAEPATASNPATATPNLLHDLLGDTSEPTSTAAAAPAVDLLDLLGGDAVPTPPAAAAASPVSLFPPTAISLGQ